MQSVHEPLVVLGWFRLSKGGQSHAAVEDRRVLCGRWLGDESAEVPEPEAGSKQRCIRCDSHLRPRWGKRHQRVLDVLRTGVALYHKPDVSRPAALVPEDVPHPAVGDVQPCIGGRRLVRVDYRVVKPLVEAGAVVATQENGFTVYRVAPEEPLSESFGAVKGTPRAEAALREVERG